MFQDEEELDPLDSIPKDLWDAKSIEKVDAWYLKPGMYCLLFSLSKYMFDANI